MGNRGSVPEKHCKHHEHHEDHGRKFIKGADPKKSLCKAPGSHHNNNRRSSCTIASTTNPFIIFFLRMRKKKPKEPVTKIARVAGKLWTKMTFDQKQKYICLANAEKKRRNGRKRRRRKR